MAQARICAAGICGARGLPPLPVPGAGGVGAAPVAAAGLGVAVAEEEVWISLENLPPYSMGQIVIKPGMVLPAGHVSLGTDKALILTVSFGHQEDQEVRAVHFHSQGPARVAHSI